MLARVPLVLLSPLLSPHLPLPRTCDAFCNDDGCLMPEDDPDAENGESALPEFEEALDYAKAFEARPGFSFKPEQLSMLSLPGEPSPELSHMDVVEALMRGFQSPNLPFANAGAMRLHDFATTECRYTLTGCRGRTQGREVFAKEAWLWALPGCDLFGLAETSTIPATQTRGAMATVMVEVLEAKSFRFRSGFERTHPTKEDSTEPTKSPAPPREVNVAPTPPPAPPPAPSRQHPFFVAVGAAQPGPPPSPKPRPAVLPVPPKGFQWADSESEEAHTWASYLCAEALSRRAPEPAMSESASEEAEESPEEVWRAVNDVPEDGLDEERLPNVAPAGAAGEDEADEAQIERYQFTMYQERRPPLAGCWLVKNIVPVTQHQLFGYGD